MNILSLSKIQKEFSGEVLFTNISFDINSKDKMAIIGKNGTGKTTLLKIIQGEEPYDAGEIHKNKQATIGYLSQDIISNTEHTLLDEMLLVFHELLQLEEKMASVTKKLEFNPKNDELLQRYASLESHYLAKGGYEYHYKLNLILSKFGFTKEEYNRNINTFSGGEKTRMAFAKLLLVEPDLLILDEPTNHLDIDIIEWLEDYLNKYTGAVLIVTHDKYFISKVCRHIMEIENNTTQHYYGTYEQYEEEKAKRYISLMRQYERQQKEIAHLQSFVDRFKYNAKRASIAKDREKKIDRIEKMNKPHQSKKRVHLSFQPKRSTRDIILEAKEVTIGYDKPLLDHINFHMRGYDKLAIIGPNGTGKTTLLRVIEKKLSPLQGKISFLRQYKIGYFDQNQATLHYHKTIFEEIHDYYPMYTNYDVRSIAAKFLFYGEDLDKPIHILSGGEKVRLVLLLLMLEEPDLLILDEPTNHLDIETKNIVEDVLLAFEGPIIFVSHDRYFINKIGTKILHLSHEDVTEFDGNYDQFKEYVNKKSIVKESKKTTTKKPKKNKTKELNRLENDIHSLEKTINELELQTFHEDVYMNHTRLQEIQHEMKKHKSQLAELEDEYYQLYEQNESKKG